MPAVWAYGLILFLIVAALGGPASAAVKIQEVRSPKGITAWLVEDHTLPIVTIRFGFEGGSAQDPAGKEGLANLLGTLFDEGAGDLDSEAFQIALDNAGAEMSFDSDRDHFHGSMRLLTESKAAALGLLKLAINAPRFDDAPVERMRSQLISGIQSRARDPEYEAQRLWLQALFGDHPYARRDEGTEETLRAITIPDLEAFHRSVFARKTLRVAVVGAIDAETLGRDLDDLFATLPANPAIASVPDVAPRLGQDLRFEYPLRETSIRLAYPGVPREDPQFFAAYLMNDILGGNTFTSRLFEEVREKRGLTYGISSSLLNLEHADALVVSTSTRPEKAREALGVIRDVVARLATEGPTETELAAAKKYMIGAYAINNLDSSGAIASTLLGLQTAGLGIDYMERRGALIEAVTLDAVKAAAKRLLTVRPALQIVGPADDAEEKG